ncbi:hypothetical protein L1049_011525 [Liquidambar formosana]|uniref:Uncharacterized protein n=1 Tax=Liquidambar formosana TaxID=63359 RepID=A0AAP0RRY5_LIQFO
MSCFHSSGVCLIGSACLYHSLVKMLKLLIHRAQCCQHLRLLDKHCAVPSFNQNANGNDCSRFEGYESKINSSKKGLAGVQVEGNLQVEKSHGFDDYKRTPEAFDNQLHAK